MDNSIVAVGALVFPYNVNGLSAGYDPLAVFQPKLTNDNMQIYLRIFGLGIPDEANYYAIRSVQLTGKDIQEGISFKLIAEHVGAIGI